MKKTIATVLILASLMSICAYADGQEENPTPAVIEVNTEADESEPTLFLADDSAHPALMALKSDGCFHPGSPVTKGELCRMLFPMFEGLRGGGTPFPDVARGAECFEAVTALYRAGLLPEERGEEYHPSQSVTRSYFCGLLQTIAAGLGGEDGQRVRLLAIDMAAGLTAEEGAKRSDTAWVSRAEAALVLESLLGREPAENDLFMNGCVPKDVSAGDFAWACIADAVTDGKVLPVSEGVHRLYGWLYASWDDGSMITDMDYGVWTFGENGRYTTGSAALDEYLFEALEASGANDCEDGTEALKAAYLYIKYNFEYLVRPEDMETIPVGETGWEYDRAERFFRYGGGTCYGYAAAFGLMARALGYHAYAVAAEVNQFYGAHGFVVIPDGEEDVIYDVEMEATRPERHRDFDLFGISNYAIYNYWYVADWRL